jgi:hypothetical protein
MATPLSLNQEKGQHHDHNSRHGCNRQCRASLVTDLVDAGVTVRAVARHRGSAGLPAAVQLVTAAADGLWEPTRSRAIEILERIVSGAPSHPARHAIYGLISP